MVEAAAATATSRLVRSTDGTGGQGILVLTYTPAAGGSPYTMPAATGTVALAGQAATLTKTTAGANPVQKNGGTVSANASIATSLPGATTAGNTILIFASGGGTITTPSGFTSRSPAVNALGCYIFEKLVASGNSTDTPTLTMSGAYDAVWQIAEYKNITAYDTSSGTSRKQRSTRALFDPDYYARQRQQADIWVCWLNHPSWRWRVCRWRSAIVVK